MNRKKILTLYLCFIAFSLQRCTNSFVPNAVQIPSPTPTASTQSGRDKWIVSNITVSSVTSTSQIPNVNIFMDTTNSSGPFLNHCNSQTGGATTSKPCMCQFKWNEINAQANNTGPISRSTNTNVSAVQYSLITCAAPSVYNTEIQTGTQIQITVIPGPSNPDTGNFQMTPFNFIKNSSQAAGSFQDAEGNIFDNILRYSCFQKMPQSIPITNKRTTQTNPTTGQTVTVSLASQFCIGTTTSQGCPTTSSQSSYSSAQSTYYNLYIRNSERGDINQYNQSFTCPFVQESLNNNGTIGTQNQAWPLDATFALSLGPTDQFPIGVEANTKLSGGSDPTAVSSTCAASTQNTSSSNNQQQSNMNTIISSCLGFAAKPNTDGTCPAIRDPSGRYRQTFRLRRFAAIYGKSYSNTGSPLAGVGQSVDMIYVLDRPIQMSSTTANPMNPYTMYGPKPCPFSVFIQSSSILPNNIYPGYYSTNNSILSNTNWDGIEFPNEDNATTLSCSTVFPIAAQDGSKISFTTINKHRSDWNTQTYGYKHLYIRPKQLFTPHYTEDLSFQACAPQASPFKDAPLHFSKDPLTGNMAWCAEAYPTQNNNFMALSLHQSQKPFTSHLVSNTMSNICQFTPLTIPLPVPAYAQNHYGQTNTCDRTVSSQNLDWFYFPLLASASDVESAIVSDSSYGCLVSYDNNGPKTKKSTPSDGCCNINSVFPNPTAHLETDVPCNSPRY